MNNKEKEVIGYNSLVSLLLFYLWQMQREEADKDVL